MRERPPVVSDGLCFGYWFCRCDCFRLFLRVGRGFVGKDEVPSPSLPYPPLVLPSALLFVLQQPAYAVQDFAHFVFVVALANILYECFGVYPVFRVFPRLFAVARVVVVGVVVAPVAESHAVGVDAHEGFGLRDDGFIFVFALARPFVP